MAILNDQSMSKLIRQAFDRDLSEVSAAYCAYMSTEWTFDKSLPVIPQGVQKGTLAPIMVYIPDHEPQGIYLLLVNGRLEIKEEPLFIAFEDLKGRKITGFFFGRTVAFYNHNDEHLRFKLDHSLPEYKGQKEAQKAILRAVENALPEVIIKRRPKDKGRKGRR